ncbi:MAG TPA: N-acetyltransferase, partial [Bacteroidia bacterium]|nr:N-acetyltransferase [Bacteroidia bacterium]
LNKIAFGQANEAMLVDALRRNSNVFIPELSIVALYKDAIVGHILFTKVWITDHQGNKYQSLSLAPMAVLPAYQNQGIGGQLINKGLSVAAALGHKSVIVLGHEHYYPKFGFKPANIWHIKAPFDVPSKNFMAIELVTNGLAQINGTVFYPPEFDAV